MGLVFMKRWALMELWDILDGDGNKTGKTVERGKPMGQDEYHLLVHVWINNSKGEFLITKRTPNKIFPNMLERTVGAAMLRTYHLIYRFFIFNIC